MARQKKNVDWLTLGLDYRAGMKSMRMLSKEYGISTARISQIANERAWSRDLAVRIKDQMQAKLDRSVLDGKLDAKTKITENLVVEANAQIQTVRILRHRTDITRARSLVMTLFDELEILTGDTVLLRDLARLKHGADVNGTDKLTEVYNRVISMPSRVDAMKKLSDTLRILIALEREAFGIDRKIAETEDGIESVIRRVMEKASTEGA
jgi:hypothetical protein